MGDNRQARRGARRQREFVRDRGDKTIAASSRRSLDSGGAKTERADAAPDTRSPNPIRSTPNPPVDETDYGSRPREDARRPVGVLAVIEGIALGRTFAVFEGETTLGRDWFDHRRISRRHATIVHRAGITAIRKDAERNSVLVNGSGIDGQELNDGDVIELGQADGRVVLRFREV